MHRARLRLLPLGVVRDLGELAFCFSGAMWVCSWLSSAVVIGHCRAASDRPGTARKLGLTRHSGDLDRYAPGARYRTCPALRRASMVSSMVRRTVVSNELSAPPPLIDKATAAMETLSGASHKL